MRIVKDDTYGDVEKLYDGIEQVINISANCNCKPIICNMDDHDYSINYTRIIDELASLRSIIRKILRASFVVDSDTHNSITQMYNMIWSVIKGSGTNVFQVFTTNYDLVMETYSKKAGFEIINGFKPDPYQSWTWANAWDQRSDLPPLYLAKMHGSIHWHRDADSRIVETESIADVNANNDIMIAPTEGAKDYNREPFSVLINRFREVIKKVDVLLVIGFSYRDDEIVNIIKEGLQNEMILISISPDAVTSIRRVSNGDIQTKEINGRHFKVIDSQIILYEQTFGMDTIDDIRSALETVCMAIRRNIEWAHLMRERRMRAHDENIENS